MPMGNETEKRSEQREAKRPEDTQAYDDPQPRHNMPSTQPTINLHHMVTDNTQPATLDQLPPHKLAIGLQICDAIAEQPRGLHHICRENPDWPTSKTFYEWLKLSPQLRDRYACARDLQADLIVDEIIQIADDTASDWIEDEDGKVRVDNEAVQRSRLRIDSRKWLAGKLNPKKYGDRQVIEHDISDGLAARMEAAEQRRLANGNGSASLSSSSVNPLPTIKPAEQVHELEE